MWKDPEPPTRPPDNPGDDAGDSPRPAGSRGVPRSNTLVRTLEGHITAWSPGMADRYGYPAGDALGQPAHRLLRTSFPRALADIEAMLLSRNSWTGGAIHRHADGGPVPAVNRWTLCRDAAGDAWRVTEVHSDIGRPVAAPDADLAASNEALADIVVSHEALADIIALLAHELSEPLTAIGNYVAGARRILQAGWPDLGQARMAMGEAVRQIGRGGDGVSLLRAVAAAIRER